MQIPLLRRLALLAAIPTLAIAAVVAPSDPHLRYIGRFDTADTNGPRASWSASTIAFTVSGGDVSASFNESGQNHWQVVIDGQPSSVLALEKGTHSYTVATGLTAGTHTVELVKRTEAHVGLTQFLGLTIDDAARLLPTAPRPRRIEVIGDSISCGYGNEAPVKEEHFTPATENAWLAYGAVAARAVDADYICIAWSGRKLWPDNTIVSLYDHIAPPKLQSQWDFTQWTPDVVVINLGTNDFAKLNPDETGWVTAYVEFIARIRKHYPNAPIYCALGTMMSDWPKDRTPRTVILGYLNKVVAQANAAGGPPVRLLDFGVQKQSDGIGADWHPSARTHQLMADKLAAALKQDLGW